MPAYYTTTDPMSANVIIIRLDGDQMSSFTQNPDNADYRAYEEWLAEGNTPLPWPPVA